METLALGPRSRSFRIFCQLGLLFGTFLYLVSFGIFSCIGLVGEVSFDMLAELLSMGIFDQGKFASKSG